MQKLIRFLQNNILLVLIIIFGGVIRLVGLDSLPPSLNWDEVSHGYNAYSILKTGKDEWGETFPTIFKAYGDYKLPVYVYATVPRVAIFGLNEFSVRLTSATAGTLLILFTFLLVVYLFKRRTLALLSALLVAIEPWSFFFSRTAVEANLALFFIVAGAWLTLFGLSRKRWWFVLGALAFGLSVWTYNSARIFVPLLILSLIFIYRNELANLWKSRMKLVTCYLLLVAIFFLPMFYQLANPVGQARYNWVAILDQGAAAQIDSQRNTSKLPGPLPRMVHNKFTYLAENFSKNYLSYFSPKFLFFEGGSQYQFSVPRKGLVYPSELPFIIIGIVWLFKKRSKESTLLLAWLLLSPVAASLTRESQHALRSIVMMPIPQVLAGIGLVAVWDYVKNKKLEIGMRKTLRVWKLEITLRHILVAIYAVSLLYFIENYAIAYVGKYREEFSWSWQYGYKEMVNFVRDNYDKYDRIIITKKYGEPHDFVLFYWPWPPDKYRNDPNLIRFHQSDWYWVDRFDKFYFVNDWQVPRTSSEFVLESGGNVKCQMSNVKCLLVTSPGNYPPGWKLIETINFLDGKPVFDILEKIEQ